MLPILAALLLIALGALAGTIISTALALRNLPETLFSAALPDEVIDDYVTSLRNTWKGFAARKLVAASRSRLLALVWKGSWMPVLAILCALAIPVGSATAICYYGVLSFPCAIACATIPALQFGIVAYILEWLAVGFLTRSIGKLRSLAANEISRRIPKAQAGGNA